MKIEAGDKRQTIIEVARISGVSKSTVSRVLNNSKDVNEETRRKILAIIEKMDFTPSHMARSLKGKQTYTIGVVLEDILNPFYMEVAKGIENCLRQNKYTMLLTSSNWDYKEEEYLVNVLMKDKVDGFILNTIRPDSDAVKTLKKANHPFIMLDCKTTQKNISWVAGDNVQGGYLAVKHLLELGHRHILCLKGRNNQATEERLKGADKAIKEFEGVAKGESVFLEALGNARTVEDTNRILRNYLTARRDKDFPTAVFATNDLVAIGVMTTLMEMNRLVPEDVSVMGYDDIYLSDKVNKPLTTIHQSKYRMGEIAARELMDIVLRKDSHVARQFLIQPRLIVRGSCAPVKK